MNFNLLASKIILYGGIITMFFFPFFFIQEMIDKGTIGEFIAINSIVIIITYIKYMKVINKITQQLLIKIKNNYDKSSRISTLHVGSNDRSIRICDPDIKLK